VCSATAATVNGSVCFFGHSSLSVEFAATNWIRRCGHFYRNRAHQLFVPFYGAFAPPRAKISLRDESTLIKF
jgi:hypothetical protein